MQGALVAPTEVLAQQHYKLFQSWIAQIPTLRKKPPVLEILTLGSGNDREKEEVSSEYKHKHPGKGIQLIFEFTGDFDRGSEPIVFVLMSPYSKLESNITGTVKRPLS